jgi:hypothetical protein
MRACDCMRILPLDMRGIARMRLRVHAHAEH